jgi:hypothetical protein
VQFHESIVHVHAKFQLSSVYPGPDGQFFFTFFQENSRKTLKKNKNRESTRFAQRSNSCLFHRQRRLNSAEPTKSAASTKTHFLKQFLGLPELKYAELTYVILMIQMNLSMAYILSLD